MKYSIIYADPAWKYEFPHTRSEWSEDYPTMNTDTICALPIGELAASDCALFIWGIWTKLPDILEVIEAWGFEYKTVAFVWIKQNPTGFGVFMGMGSYTRSNSEYCLLATRGNPKRTRADVLQVIHAPVLRHSQKPSDVREKIVSLMGDLPRVELFARKRVDGWDAWGNEVVSDLELAA